MSLMSQKEAKAAGRRAGRNAASWVFDGNTTEATYRAFLRGMAEGDPKVMDEYQAPEWLSGQWAGESISELLGTCDTEREQERLDGVMDAYETAADMAYQAELERAARAALRGSGKRST